MEKNQRSPRRAEPAKRIPPHGCHCRPCIYPRASGGIVCDGSALRVLLRKENSREPSLVFKCGHSRNSITPSSGSAIMCPASAVPDTEKG